MVYLVYAVKGDEVCVHFSFPSLTKHLSDSLAKRFILVHTFEGFCDNLHFKSGSINDIHQVYTIFYFSCHSRKKIPRDYDNKTFILP